jgi:hypothetical protein
MLPSACAESSADLAHPNLVHLNDLASVEGRWFFTMEYVERGDFLTYVWGSSQTPPHLIQTGPSVGELTRLSSALKQLAQGLNTLHQAVEQPAIVSSENWRACRQLQWLSAPQSRDHGINKGTCDVIVTDGFVGNVVLKVCEGVFDFSMKMT